MNIYTNEKTIFDYAHQDQNRSKPYYGYVYFSFNKINGKKYVGQSGKIFNGRYFGSGTRISKAIKKYRKQNFLVIVLEWCDYQEDNNLNKNFLDSREEFWLKFFNVKEDKKFYNVIDTATPSLRGKDNGFYKKTHNKQSLEKQRISNENRSEEAKADSKRRQKESLQLYYESEEGQQLKQKIKNRRTGKKDSLETIEKRKRSVAERTTEEKELSSKKLSNSLLEFYSSEKGKQTKEKMSIDRTGRKMPEGFAELVSKRMKGIPKSQEHVDKVNRNPEKIRKTAETHRGMKRSEQARKNISDSKKGKPARNKGEVWYFDPINKINISILPGEIAPKGWIKGSGRVVFHDPKTLINYTCFEGEQQPNWVKGRINKK
jgi:hypothetical protein